MKLKGAEILVESLIDQHAAHAADGYARSTGKVGVCVATSGPGATNLVTGIATAMLDSIPMVAITGNVGTKLVGKDSFQEVDITGITLPITKHNYFVNDINDLEDVVREAFKIAKSDRPGPVLIDIPKDVQNAYADFEPKGPSKAYDFIQPSEKRLKQAAEAIAEAKRPYIYIGGGVIAAGCENDVLELADKIDAVIGTSLMGISAVPTDNPRFLGMEGMHGHFASSVAQDDADCVIAIGVRFSDRATGDVKKFVKRAKVIHMDVDFAEINKNIDADIGVRGDLNISVKQLADLVPQRIHPEWIKHVDELKRKGAAFEPQAVGVTPHKIMDVINDIREPESVVATDVGQHQMWAAQFLKFQCPRTFATSGGLGTMGYGVGAAVGAAVGTRKPTVLITGDGSFGMNLNEVVTAVTQKLPLTIVIMNNQVLGMVRQWQTLFYEKRYSNTTLSSRSVDYVKLAEAFGAKGVVTTSVDAFRDAFDTAYHSNSVTLIDCRIDPDEFVLPMLPPGGANDDIICTKGDVE